MRPGINSLPAMTVMAAMAAVCRRAIVDGLCAACKPDVMCML